MFSEGAGNYDTIPYTIRPFEAAHRGNEFDAVSGWAMHVNT